jgi:hypothetical protein
MAGQGRRAKETLAPQAIRSDVDLCERVATVG